MLSSNTEGVRIRSFNSSKTGLTTNNIEHDGSGDLKVAFTGSFPSTDGNNRRFDGTISNLPIFSPDIAGPWSNTNFFFSGNGEATLSGGNGWVAMYHPVTSNELPAGLVSGDPITRFRVRNFLKVDSGDSVNVSVFFYIKYVDPAKGWQAIGVAQESSITNTSYQNYYFDINFPYNGEVSLKVGEFDQVAIVIYGTSITSGETLYVRGATSYPNFQLSGYPDDTNNDKFSIQRASTPEFEVTRGGNIRMNQLSFFTSTSDLKFDPTTKNVSYFSSTRKTKKDIKPLDQTLLESFSKLKPVTYIQTNDPNQNILSGFIAEEAAEAHPLFAGWGPNYKTSENGTLLINEDPIDDQIVPTTIPIETLLTTAIAKTQQLDQKINQEFQNILETDDLA